MLKRSLSGAMIALVSSLTISSTDVAAQSDQVTAGPQITGVLFELRQGKTRIVVQGKNLLLSNANIPANGRPPAGQTGKLYGKALHFNNGNSSHMKKFSAGYYAPDEGRHDWIGLTDMAQSSDVIAFSLGSYFQSKRYALNEGDLFFVSVNGTPFRGTVSFQRLPRPGAN
jgi:hypothetical protein